MPQYSLGENEQSKKVKEVHETLKNPKQKVSICELRFQTLEYQK